MKKNRTIILFVSENGGGVVDQNFTINQTKPTTTK